jgi:HSP20 family molecular chaperone IbpA
LPKSADVQNIQASMNQGLLEVKVPKKAEAQEEKKTIPIQ